jgi:hypothetical protein
MTMTRWRETWHSRSKRVRFLHACTDCRLVGGTLVQVGRSSIAALTQTHQR